MRAARSRLWVAISAARPVERTRTMSASKTRSEVAGSRLPVGSSARSRRGALASARQKATRCCSPARERGGAVVGAGLDADALQEVEGAGLGLGARGAVGELGEDDVLQRP